MSTIKDLIQNLAESSDEQIIPSEFNSLLLEDQELNRELTADDKAYLEEFVNVELLSFSKTGLKSLRNLPELPELKRIELSGNALPASALKELLRYKQLHTIKFDDNLVGDYAELEPLKGSLFGNLSFAGNPIASKEDYREKMFELFPELQMLDGRNEEGESVASDDEIDSDLYGDEEAGEEEIDEETLKKLREQGFDLAEDDDEDGEADYGDDFEEGEDNIYGDEDGEDDYDDEDDEEPQQPASKRQKK